MFFFSKESICLIPITKTALKSAYTLARNHFMVFLHTLAGNNKEKRLNHFFHKRDSPQDPTNDKRYNKKDDKGHKNT